MTPPVLTREPASFAAGETVKWNRSFADYPSNAGWSCTYYFAGVDVFQVAGVADGAGGFDFTSSADSTATKKPGTYTYIAYAWKGVAGVDLERYEVASGEFTLEKNITSAVAGDFQTHAERMLAAIEARLEGRLADGADLESYGLAGRQVMKIPAEKLHALRIKYQLEVERIRNGGQLPPYEAEFTPRRIGNGFGYPTQ